MFWIARLGGDHFPTEFAPPRRCFHALGGLTPARKANWPPNARWLVQQFPVGPLRRRRSINDAVAWTELHGRGPAPARLSHRRVRIHRFLDQRHQIDRLQYSESFNRYLFSEVRLVPRLTG